MSEIKITLRVTNRTPVEQLVVIEPWTGEYTLGPTKSFDIVAEGDSQYPLHLEIVGDGLVVTSFDSKGALLTVFQDGRELRSE